VADPSSPTRLTNRARHLARLVLAAALLVAGFGHLGPQREEFQAQVPSWFPIDADVVVVGSGVVELALGAALVLGRRRIAPIGVVVAAFFVVIFPGNVAQYLEHTDAFGLDSDTARFVRLWFQPLLVAWALWSTGGGTCLRAWWRGRSPRGLATPD
jgi:uncharacterized membrane protein